MGHFLLTAFGFSPVDSATFVNAGLAVEPVAPAAFFMAFMAGAILRRCTAERMGYDVNLNSRELRYSIPFVFVCSFEEMTVATCHIRVSVFCEQSRVVLLSIHVSDCSCAIVSDQLCVRVLVRDCMCDCLCSIVCAIVCVQLED